MSGSPYITCNVIYNFFKLFIQLGRIKSMDLILERCASCLGYCKVYLISHSNHTEQFGENLNLNFKSESIQSVADVKHVKKHSYMRCLKTLISPHSIENEKFYQAFNMFLLN